MLTCPASRGTGPTDRRVGWPKGRGAAGHTSVPGRRPPLHRQRHRRRPLRRSPGGRHWLPRRSAPRPRPRMAEPHRPPSFPTTLKTPPPIAIVLGLVQVLSRPGFLWVDVKTGLTTKRPCCLYFSVSSCFFLSTGELPLPKYSVNNVFFWPGAVAYTHPFCRGCEGVGCAAAGEARGRPGGQATPAPEPGPPRAVLGVACSPWASDASPRHRVLGRWVPSCETLPEARNRFLGEGRYNFRSSVHCGQPLATGPLTSKSCFQCSCGVEGLQ